MKKIIAPVLICLVLGSGFISSCASSKFVSPDQVYKPIDYTENDIVEQEIKRIDSILEKDEVKALWRAHLLVKNTSSNEKALSCLDSCAKLCVSKYDEALEKKDYLLALRYYSSLKNISSPYLSSMKTDESKLNELLKKNIPALSETGRKFPKISECITGTVTVLVDKGIKIENGRGFADMVLGSGFFISKDGYLITNHHVIEDCVDSSYEGYTRIYIKLSEDTETRIPAKIIGYDSSLDLALLKSEIDAPYYFELGSSSQLAVGDKVYAIGSPLGLESTLTSGIISSTDRMLNMKSKVFQIDAAVNSGNSGGPMIDSNGRVQGIVFAGVQFYQGLNFAIPVECLKADLPFLYAGGERKHSWLGAYGKTKKAPGVGAKNEGLLVQYVMPGSPAHIAGLREDDVIVAVNGKRISSLDEFNAEVMTYPSSTVSLITYIDAQGEQKQLDVLFEERPKNPGYSVYKHDLIENALYPIIGLQMKHVSSATKNLFVVTKVLPYSIADDNGFSEGDTIQLLNVEASRKQEALAIELYSKKRKNGYLNLGFALQAYLDSPNYF